MLESGLSHLFIATIMFTQSQQVSHAETIIPNNQNVVYRIYINDEVIGLINNKAEYDTFVENHMKELLQHKLLTLEAHVVTASKYQTIINF